MAERQALDNGTGAGQARPVITGTGQSGSATYHSRSMRLLGRIGIALVALLAVAFLYLTFRPIAGGSVFAGEVNAAADHDAAVAKFNAGLAAADGPEVDPRCRSSLSDHGVTTDVVVVIFHGYTNCPYGFAGLAQAIFDRGANVLVPRLPHHGLLDRIGPQGHTWTAEEMVALADEAVDVARGLGRKVVVVGLSAGGAIASWVAQNRPDVDRVVGLQPFLGIKYVPTLLGSQMVNLAETLPDSLAWWDEREASIPPDYGYPQRSTRAVAEALRLSAITIDQAGSTAPAA